MGLHFGGNDAWSGVLIVRKCASRAKTRYVACAPAMSRVGGAAHARQVGERARRSAPGALGRRARKHAHVSMMGAYSPRMGTSSLSTDTEWHKISWSMAMVKGNDTSGDL